MVKGELQKEEEDHTRTQDGQNDGRGLGLSHVTRQQGLRHVADDEQARDGRGGTQQYPRHESDGDDAQDDRGEEGHEAVPVQADPFHQQQCVHGHAALGGHPQQRGQNEGVTAADGGSVQQVVDVVVEFIDIVPVDVVVHVGGDLRERERRG
jgi:hypothetical protein